MHTCAHAHTWVHHIFLPMLWDHGREFPPCLGAECSPWVCLQRACAQLCGRLITQTRDTRQQAGLPRLPGRHVSQEVRLRSLTVILKRLQKQAPVPLPWLRDLPGTLQRKRTSSWTGRSPRPLVPHLVPAPLTCAFLILERSFQYFFHPLGP